MTLNRTYYGVPGVITIMTQAEWVPFDDDATVKFFDGLNFYPEFVLSDRQNKISPIFCEIQIIDSNSGEMIPISGFISRKCAKYLRQDEFCILGHRKTVDRIDLEGKVVGQTEIRESFTTCFDSTHKVAYDFTFILGAKSRVRHKPKTKTIAATK